MIDAKLQKPNRRYRVLVSDDNDEARDTITALLESDGFDLYSAASGEEAVEVFQHQPVDLLIMDMYMPGITGLQTLELIRQIAHRSVPCIFVTATDSEELRRQAMVAGAFTVLRKPVSADLVRAAVRLALKKYF